MRRGTRKVLISQVVLIVATMAAVAMLRTGVPAALAAAYGGGIALVNVVLLAWRSRRAGAEIAANGNWGALGLMWGMVERFAFTLGAFVLGLGALRLEPVSLLLGFAVAQLGYLGAAVNSRRG